MESIAEAERIRSKGISESRTRAAETRKRHTARLPLLPALPRMAAEHSKALLMISSLISYTIS